MAEVCGFGVPVVAAKRGDLSTDCRIRQRRLLRKYGVQRLADSAPSDSAKRAELKDDIFRAVAGFVLQNRLRFLCRRV